MTAGDASARGCVSSDGVLLGVIAGVHRDTRTNVATWAVLDSGRHEDRFLMVPLSMAQPSGAGMQIPYTSAQVASSPRIRDPTRMLQSEQERLAAHYTLAEPAATPPAGRHGETLSMIRSEETISVSALEWRPYKRARVRKVVRSEDVEYVVAVRREELVIEEEPISSLERLEVAFQVVEQPRAETVEVVLHREEVVLQKRVVPYERARVSAVTVPADWTIETTVAKERVDVERKPLKRR